jgi:hypothetical protein
MVQIFQLTYGGELIHRTFIATQKAGPTISTSLQHIGYITNVVANHKKGTPSVPF